jgi:hypothetical protein
VKILKSTGPHAIRGATWCPDGPRAFVPILLRMASTPARRYSERVKPAIDQRCGFSRPGNWKFGCYRWGAGEVTRAGVVAVGGDAPAFRV